MAGRNFVYSISTAATAPLGRITTVLRGQLASSDLPDVPAANLTGTIADARLSGNVPLLTGGLLPTSVLPALAITEVYPVANTAARLALTAERGDIAIQADDGRTYALSTDDPTTDGDWLVISTPGALTSVNGMTGIVVLDYTDVGAQPLDATLTALAGTTVAADKGIYATGADAFATYDLTAFGRSLGGAADESAARGTLGGTTVGQALFTLTNPSAIRFIRINADNSVTARTAAEMLSDIGGISGLDINGLTATDPAFGDSLPLYDLSATANRKATIERVLGLQPAEPGGRLTLTTGVPVTTSDVTNAGSLYYAPYKNDRITLWDGTRWVSLSFSQVTYTLSGISSGNVYDVFGYISGGALAIEQVAWTNSTTRASAISIQDGRYCKTSDKTRLYLGTWYASGTNLVTDNAALRGVWNMYHRVRKSMVATDNTDSWTYGSAAWRYANNSSGNRVQFVIGLAEDSVNARTLGQGNVSAVQAFQFGIGLDSSTANIAQVRAEGAANAPCNSEYTGTPDAGYHYLAWIEYARAGTPTIYGDAGTVTIQSGLLGSVWC